MITGATQDIVLERIEPDPGQLPCPSQRVLYQCQVLVQSSTLTWTLPNGDGTLEFDILSNEGDVRPTPPGDGVYTATLTNKTEDDDPDTNRFFFASTLLILETVNDTSLTCSGGTVANPVENNTDIILSGGYALKALVVHYLTVIHVPGIPDPVSGLDYDDTVVIESSVTLQWTRPSYTGGVSLMNYSVSANGQTWPVSDERELVSYTTSGLVYGEVQVTAINSCDQQSLTTSINIPAQGDHFNASKSSISTYLLPSAPLEVESLSVDIINCEDYGNPFILILISWTVSYSHNVVTMCCLTKQVAPREMGVVYPDVITRVTFNNRNIMCYNFASNSYSCPAYVVPGSYTVSLNRTNHLGQSIITDIFNCKFEVNI